MADLDDTLAQHSIQAVQASATPMGVHALTFAKRLHNGEIFRLIRLLNAALPHVSTPGLRHRIEDLLTSVTDGRMPMFERSETELDWALESLRDRRIRAERNAADPEAVDPEDVAE
jgi:hypothetical protein